MPIYFLKNILVIRSSMIRGRTIQGLKQISYEKRENKVERD